MRVVLASLVAAALVAVGGGADAAVFGLEKGASLASLRVVRKVENNAHAFFIEPPVPNPKFEEYLALATPGVGLCKIVAVGRNISNDKDGADVRAEYDSMKSALAGRYGEATDEFDFLHRGALWREPHEWAMSIYKGERTKTAMWGVDKHASLTPDLAAIVLSVKAVGPDTTYLQLAYEFSNMSECQKAVEASNARGL